MTRTHFHGQKVKGQGHQAALLTAALTREAGAAVTVRKYSAWESTATLRLLGGARQGGEGRGYIVLPCAQLVLGVTGPADSLLGINLTECGLLENDLRSCV